VSLTDAKLELRERVAFVASVRAALRDRGRDTVAGITAAVEAAETRRLVQPPPHVGRDEAIIERRSVQIVLEDMVRFGQATRARSDIHRGRPYFYELTKAKP
jgi:hypothetical protein